MKRTPKVFISILLLAAMLMNMLPIAAVTVGAADEDFYYQRVSTMTPGKEYLVVDTNQAGNGYALKPADGAASANKLATSSGIVAIDASGKIAGSAELEAYEWEFVQAAAATAYNNVYGDAPVPVRFMLQNKSTGAYLWSTAYENDSFKMGTSLTPFQDDYSGSTYAVFDFAKGTAASAENYLSEISDLSFVDATPYIGPCLQFAASNADGHFNVMFNRASLQAENFPFATYTYHVNSPKKSGFAIYSSTDTNPIVKNGLATFAPFDVASLNRWNSGSYSLLDSLAYTDKAGNRTPSWSGKIDYLRIDPQNPTEINAVYSVDSLSITKTARGAQTIQLYRDEVSKRVPEALGGQYPSVEYPFNLFTVSQDGEAFRLTFLPDGTNKDGNFLKLASSENESAVCSGAASNVYLYEKHYFGKEQWVLVDGFEEGGEYVIANASDGKAVAVTADGTAEITVSDNKITSEIPAGAVYSAYSNANGTFGKTFWLTNDVTRGFLASSVAGGIVRGRALSSTIGGEYTTDDNGGINVRLAWNYIPGTAPSLFAAYLDKAQTVKSDMLPVGFDGSELKNGGTGKAFLFKKEYHIHTPGEITTVNATCTTDGYTETTCTSCGVTYKLSTIPALGHDYVYTAVDATSHKVTCSRCDLNETKAHTLGAYTQVDDKTHGATCAECEYVYTENHKLKSTHIDADKCGELGYTLHACTVAGCRYSYTTPDAAPSTSHQWDGGLVTKEPTCTAPGEVKYTCTRTTCLEVKTEALPAHGHVYNDNGKCMFGCGATDPDYTASAAKYIYKYVDVPVNGREYVIANTNDAGKAFVAAPSPYGDDAVGLLSVPSNVTVDSIGKYLTMDNAGPLTTWTAQKNGDKFSFQNKKDSSYLWGKNTTSTDGFVDDEWVNKNIGSSAAADGNSYFTVRAASAATSDGGYISSGIGSRVIADNSYLLGFKDLVSTNGFSVPGKGVALESDHGPNEAHYLPIAGYLGLDGTKHFVGSDNDIGNGITGDFVLDVDIALENSSAGMTIMRPDWNNSPYGVRVLVFGDNIALVEASGKIGEKATIHALKKISDVTGKAMTYGSDAWHHVRIVSDKASNTVCVYFDGCLVPGFADSAVSGNFTFEVKPENIRPGGGTGANTQSYKVLSLFNWIPIEPRRFGLTDEEFANIGFTQHIYGNTEKTWIDNIIIVSDGIYWHDDFDGNGNMYYSGQTAEIVKLTDNVNVNQNADIAKDVFIADNDSSNRLYFYEKQYQYTVNYFYGGVQDTSKTETGYMPAGASLTAKDKPVAGYAFSNADPAKTITVTESGNVINMYYESGYRAADDTYAIDFASTSIANSVLAANDVKSNGASAAATKVSASFSGNLGTIYAASQMNTTSAVSGGVTASVDSTDIVVTSANTSSFTSEFYVEYKVTLNGSTAYTYAKLTVIPATSIYFEDNSGFVTFTNGKYTDGKALNWTAVGNEGSVPAAVYDDVYGYSSTYAAASFVQYSGGSSKALYIDSDTVDPAAAAKATFTFTGTGFDILSHCNNRTGIVLVDIYNAANQRVKGLAVNNYLGYDYVNGEWVKNSSNGDKTFQVPVIRCDSLAYGTYKVVVTPLYQRSLKGDTVAETTQFYFDGVRIYSPLKSELAESVYNRDGEANTVVYDFGDLLVNNVEDKWYDSYNMGVMYIENNRSVSSAADYVKYGPNHEVYLANGNSVNFYLKATGATPEKILISAALADGSGEAALVVNGTVVAPIKSGTDMYYDITRFVKWTDGVSDIISISNNKSGILAISTVKAAYSASAGTASISFLSYSAPVMISNAAKYSADDTVFRTSALGDVNGDGKFTAVDLLLLRRLISDGVVLSDAQVAACDMNGDGKISIVDLVKLRSYIAG